MSGVQKKSIQVRPDETRQFDLGKLDLATVNGVCFGLGTLQPGWSWSSCVKPIVGGHSCQAPHTLFVISGCMEVIMDDGEKVTLVPGDVSYLPPGHDAKVVGKVPFVSVDVTGMADYAKKT